MGSETLAIRPAGVHDIGAVAALHRTVRTACLPYLPCLHTAEEDLAFFRDRVFPTCDVRVADRVSGLSGFCAFRPGWIDHLYILPAFQKAGLGTAFVDLAKEGQSRLNLWVFQRNAAAIEFYRKQGFALSRMTDGADNEEQEPDALLEWLRP